MDSIDTLTKIFVTSAQNILGSDIKLCKLSFMFTSIGVGLSILINSFYLIKIKNENKLIKNKVNLLLNEQKLIIYDFITKNIIDNKKCLHEKEKETEKDSETESYDFLYCE